MPVFADMSVDLRFPEVLQLADDVGSICKQKGQGALIILRGMPGSGKSSFAHELAYCVQRRRLRAEVCSADEFFFNEHGEYVYDRAKIKDVHQQCQQRFKAALSRGVDCIIIDNSNLSIWEVNSYHDDGSLSGYDVKYVEFNCDSFQEARHLLVRTQHNIDDDTLDGKLNAYTKTRISKALKIDTDDSDRFFAD